MATDDLDTTLATIAALLDLAEGQEVLWVGAPDAPGARALRAVADELEVVAPVAPGAGPGEGDATRDRGGRRPSSASRTRRARGPRRGRDALAHTLALDPDEDFELVMVPELAALGSGWREELARLAAVLEDDGFIAVGLDVDSASGATLEQLEDTLGPLCRGGLRTFQVAEFYGIEVARTRRTKHPDIVVDDTEIKGAPAVRRYVTVGAATERGRKVFDRLPTQALLRLDPPAGRAAASAGRLDELA